MTFCADSNLSDKTTKDEFFSRTVQTENVGLLQLTEWLNRRKSVSYDFDYIQIERL